MAAPENEPGFVSREELSDRLVEAATKPVCEHDLRRDPFFMYPSNPPQERIVCSKPGCDHSFLRVIAASPHPHMRSTWPKA